MVSVVDWQKRCCVHRPRHQSGPWLLLHLCPQTRSVARHNSKVQSLQVSSAARRCTIADCMKHYCTAVALECHLHWTRHVTPQQPGFKSGGLCCFGPYRSESTTAGSTTQLISWSRPSCWSDAHCYSASLTTPLVNGDVVCSVMDQNGGHTEHVSLTACTVKWLLGLETSTIAYSTTFLAAACIRRGAI